MTRWGNTSEDYLNQLDGLLATGKQQALALFFDAMDRAAAGQVVTGPDPYRAPGRITKATVGYDCAGGEVYVFEFEDGRWLEVIGSSPGWPMDELDQKEGR